MATKVKCPNPVCEHMVTVPEPNLGGSLLCPACQQLVRIGRFHVRSRLGEGAFGAVFRAFDSQLEREVAIKLLKAETMGNAEVRARFLREAKAAAKLHHPNIVPVYDASEDSSTSYIVSAFIAGRPLYELIDEVSRDPRRAVRLVVQLADALAYAHQQGVLHRDVKPANVLVNDKGTLFLTDFGLAAWLEHQTTRLTQSGAIMGTPAYMAPEQASGSTPDVGPAADQYGAGATLYHLLAGSPPFSGPAADVIIAVKTQSPVPLSKLHPGLDPRLEAICLKALAKKPELRHADCEAFAGALKAWLEGQASDKPRRLPAAADRLTVAAGMGRGAAKPTPAPRRELERRPAKKRRTLLIGSSVLGGAALLALGVVLGGTLRDSAIPMAQATASSPAAKTASVTNPRGEETANNSRTRPEAKAAPKVEPTKPNRPKPLSAPFDVVAARRAQDDWAASLGQPRELENSVGMKLALIPPGAFAMGSPDSDTEANADERPQHRVDITKPFYLGVYVVTEREYQVVMGTNPARKIEAVPVEQVCWEDAQAFCTALSDLPAERAAGRRYRLPTEAEWEYACRGGAATKYFFGSDAVRLDEFAWYEANSGGKTNPVGQKGSNPFGLYDIHGNVWQWCEDWYDAQYYRTSPGTDPENKTTATYRAIRGGHWYGFARECRSAHRDKAKPSDRGRDIGFRVAAVIIGQ